MNSALQKAEKLLKLHNGESFLILPNVWDVIGARVLQAKGFPAIATASAAISASLGFEDGEKIRRSTMIDIVGRIARSVDVPVTADIESGYAANDRELAKTIYQLIDAGVVGINIEDSLDEQHRLRPVIEQCRRIAQVREAAERKGLHLVINARIDSFMSADSKARADKINGAVARAMAYFEAGADCVYPIGPGDRETVTELRNRIDGPINILASENAESLSALREIGVNRVSFGPFIFRSCLRKFIDIAEALHKIGDYKSFTESTLSASQVKGFLASEYE